MWGRQSDEWSVGETCLVSVCVGDMTALVRGSGGDMSGEGGWGRHV